MIPGQSQMSINTLSVRVAMSYGHTAVVGVYCFDINYVFEFD